LVELLIVAADFNYNSHLPWWACSQIKLMHSEIILPVPSAMKNSFRTRAINSGYCNLLAGRVGLYFIRDMFGGSRFHAYSYLSLMPLRVLSAIE